MSTKTKPGDSAGLPASGRGPGSRPGGSVFRAAFEASQAVMYLLDPQTGVILDANPAASAFYGIPRAELAGLPILGLSTLGPRKVKSLLTRIGKSGGESFFSRHRLRSGELRDVEVHATTLTLPDGQSCIFAIVHDITARCAVEAALRQSEGLLRAVLQSVQDSICVSDAGGLLREANPAFCELMGKEREDLLGQPLSAAFEPEELRIQQSTSSLAMETLGPVSFTQRIRRPGRDVWINAVKTAVLDEDNAPIGVVSLGRDITAQKAAQAALRESERRFSTLVRQSPVGVFETDAKGRLTFANERMLRLAARPLEQLLGDDWILAIHPEDRPDFVREWHEALARKTEMAKEVRLRGARGATAWVSCRIRPMRDAGSRIIGYLGILGDITERRKAEALRSDVENVVRHDLKSPLSALQNATDLLEMTGPLNAEQAYVLGEMRGLVRRMQVLIALSLDLHAMETGQYMPQPEPVDLREVLDGLEAELRPLVEGKGLTVNVAAEEAGPFLVLGERRLLDSIFVNLLKNAAEASPEGGAITVRLSRESGEGVVTMRNLGAVPEQVRERFFEKYSTHGKAQGTGLGTYSALLMVRTLGGGIEVSTAEPGATTLLVRLPLPAPESASGPAAA